MELNIISEDSKSMIFEIKGETHTLCNVLKTQLWQNKHVKVATYAIRHPLVGVPQMAIETDGEVKPRKALSDAVEKLAGKFDEFKKECKKLK